MGKCTEALSAAILAGMAQAKPALDALAQQTTDPDEKLGMAVLSNALGAALRAAANVLNGADGEAKGG